MVYFIAVVLVIIGCMKISHHLIQKSRKNKIHRLLELNTIQDSLIWQLEDTPPVERMIKKTSRLVRVTSLLDKSIAVKIIGGGGMSALLLILNTSGIYPMSKDIIMLGITLIIMLVILLPERLKKTIIKKRMRHISDDLPFMIDLMAVCVQSGMSIESTFRYISENTADINQDIATLLARTVVKNEVSGMNAALDQLYQEMPDNEVRILCSTLQQSIKYGSSIYQVLLDLSKEIREMQLLSTEEKVASLSSKITIPMIVLIMLPLLIIIAGPGLINMVLTWSN